MADVSDPVVWPCIQSMRRASLTLRQLTPTEEERYAKRKVARTKRAAPNDFRPNRMIKAPIASRISKRWRASCRVSGEVEEPPQTLNPEPQALGESFASPTALRCEQLHACGAGQHPHLQGDATKLCRSQFGMRARSPVSISHMK